MVENNKKCFVIMPFSQTSEKRTEAYWTDHYQSFLKPLIEEIPNLEAYRSQPLRGDILKQIITNLIVSPIVVADLTDLNPNVFWELGVRQSFKHCTVTIAQTGTKPPFDVSMKSTLFYSDSHIGNEKFFSEFKDAIRDCLNNPTDPDSSVLETISGRGTLLAIVNRQENLRKLDALLEELVWNNSSLIRVVELCKENIANPSKRSFSSSRLSSSAIELLLISRYLDEDEDFYDKVSVAFTSVLALNEMLNGWIQNCDMVEKWFTQHKDLYLKRFESLKVAATEAKKKLSGTF